MPKYIDADALLAKMERRRYYIGRASDAICIIEDMPAADVEPVRHGRWVKMTGMMPPEYHGHYECSECEWHGSLYVKEQEYRRCPNCGAIMYKEGDNADKR